MQYLGYSWVGIILLLGGTMASTVSSQSNSAHAETPYSAEQLENMQTIRVLFEAISEGRQAQSSREIAAPNFVRHDLTGVNPGVARQDGAKRFIDNIRSSFPDFLLTIEDIMAAQDKVIVRFVASGTHSGTPFLNVNATGRSVSFYNINIYRFEQGKVVETWQLADLASVMKQLQD